MNCFKCGKALGNGFVCSCGFDFREQNCWFVSFLPPKDVASIADYATRNGSEIKQGSQEVFEWLSKQSAAGDSSAQIKLGDMYYYGRGVALNYREAFNWYSKAAEKGDADAQTNLAFMYGNGRGVSQDYGQAVTWYRKAAEQGHARAV